MLSGGLNTEHVRISNCPKLSEWLGFQMVGTSLDAILLFRTGSLFGWFYYIAVATAPTIPKQNHSSTDP